MCPTRAAILIVTLLGFGSSCGTTDASADANISDVPDGAPAGVPLFDQVRGNIEVVEYISIDGARTARVMATLRDSTDAQVPEVSRDGSCRLLRFDGTGFCNPSCDSEHYCSTVDTCVPWPIPQFAGPIEFSGLSVDVELNPGSDIFYLQTPSRLPSNLFADNASVTATAPGDAFPAFALATEAVAPIAFPLDGASANEFRISDGQDNVITWSPSQPGSRVRLVLRSTTAAHGLPPTHQIECDVADTGSLTIPGSLIAEMPEQSKPEVCAGFDCPLSTVQRYSRSSAPADAGEVALTVAQRIEFFLIHSVD